MLAFAGIDGVDEVHERLLQLQEARDVAQERVDQLRTAAAPAIATRRGAAARGWDDLDLDEQRALIRAVIERATVAPGRGSGRVSIELFEQ